MAGVPETPSAARPAMGSAAGSAGAPGAPTQDAGAWFDRWAAEYDGERRLLISPFDAYYGAAVEAATLAAPAAGTGPGRPSRRGAAGEPVRILDLGAGTGLLTAELVAAMPTAEVTLLDEAPAMLAQARERLAPVADRLTVLEGDLLRDLPDGPFDVIASALAIHHLEPGDQAALYLACAERLAPGGVFVNAEQLAGSTPWLEAHAVERELVHARARGFTAEAEEQAWVRWSADRHRPLAEHLRWLAEAGFDAHECVFRSWRFAVVAGWRAGASS